MKNSETLKKDCWDTIKAVLIALLISLVAVLIFALIIRAASLDERVIVPVNYAVKIIALLTGCLIGFKTPQNGILKGVLAGLLYTLFSYLIFAALDGFTSATFNWLDLLFLSVAGGISGIIAVNLKCRKS